MQRKRYSAEFKREAVKLASQPALTPGRYEVQTGVHVSLRGGAMQKARQWLGWANSLSKLRDIALIASGLIYVAGYLSRAIHAWDHNLGALPGAQFEYFVAGFVLLLPLGLLCLAVWLLWRALQWVAKWASGSDKRAKVVANVFGFGIYGSVALFLAGGIEYVARRVPLEDISLWTLLSTIGLYMMYSAALGSLQTPSETPREQHASAPPKVFDAPDKPRAERSPLGWFLRVHGWIVQFLGWITAVNLALLVLLGVLLMPLLGSIAVRYVPQELGGVQPKCATFDLVRATLSPVMQSTLAEPTGPGEKVVRSLPLEVYSSTEPWLVKVPHQAERSTTYRLNKEVVYSVTWFRCPNKQ